MVAANPYPGWWATSQNYDTTRRNTKEPDDIYTSKQDKERRKRDDFYAEKSWSKREKERKDKFKDDFMSGNFFEKQEFDQCQTDDDIHPILKNTNLINVTRSRTMISIRFSKSKGVHLKKTSKRNTGN